MVSGVDEDITHSIEAYTRVALLLLGTMELEFANACMNFADTHFRQGQRRGVQDEL